MLCRIPARGQYDISRPGHIEQGDVPFRWQALLRLVLNAGISVIPTFLYVVSSVIF